MVWVFLLFHTVCIHAAKALTRLRICAVLYESLLLVQCDRYHRFPCAGPYSLQLLTLNQVNHLRRMPLRLLLLGAKVLKILQSASITRVIHYIIWICKKHLIFHADETIANYKANVWLYNSQGIYLSVCRLLMKKTTCNRMHESLRYFKALKNLIIKVVPLPEGYSRRIKG